MRLWAVLFLSIAMDARCAEHFRIRVVSLHRPQRVEVRTAGHEPLLIIAGSHRIRLLPDKVAGFRAVNNQVDIFADRKTQTAHSAIVSNNEGGATDFLLDGGTSPRRRFRGVLHITAAANILISEIEADSETVVACKLASTYGAGTPPDVLTQAALRLCASLRNDPAKHVHFDFCDLSHCDLTRNCPSPKAAATVAARTACPAGR